MYSIFRLFRAPARMEDLTLFTRHLAGAMDARVPLHEMLRAWTLDAEACPLTDAAEDMAKKVESGLPLSVAMEDHYKLFPESYRRLVRLGEQGSTLGGIMEQMADNLEGSLETYERFRRAAVYPLLVAVVLFLNLLFLSSFIVPKYVAIYTELGGDMGGIFGNNQASMALKLAAAAMLAPITFLLAASLGLHVRGFGSGRRMLSLPMVGPILRRAETARFAGHLALLLEHRLPLAEALGLMADSTENTYVRAAITDLRDRYEAGERLGDLIAGQPLFPPSMAAMIAAAEDQGGLSRTLRGLGRFHAQRTSHGLTVLRELFEPVLLLLIGVLVALILLGIYAPLFNLAGLAA